MIITLRIDDSRAKMLKEFASKKGVTVSEFVRRAVFKSIEIEYDIDAYKSAMDENKIEPKQWRTISDRLKWWNKK